MNEPALRRARLLVSYNGSAFHGFAVNPSIPSIASALTEALSTVTRMSIEIVGAGRTDAGVHARGQVVSCDIPANSDLVLMTRQLNALCGPDIAIREIRWTTPEFHARYSALWRHYKYTIFNSATPDPFLANTAWHINIPLNVAMMQMACDPLVGVHDFSAFCRKPKSVLGERVPSMVRHVHSAKWHQADDDILIFDIRANAFCHQMVRAIVGTLVDVGLGKIRPGDMRGILISGERAAAALAPPHGLSLFEVGYED